MRGPVPQDTTTRGPSGRPDRPVSRRRFLGGAVAASLALPLGLAACGPGGSSGVSSGASGRAADGRSSSAEERPATAEAALRRLEKGNRRCVAGETTGLDASSERRRETAEEQHPFAVVLACSNSRVPPELIFDQGIGDPFVVRLAGNVVGGAGLGSIEYAVGEFGPPLLVVLGHERCGAVTAAVEEAEEGEVPPAHVLTVVDAILPAVEEVGGRPGDLVDNAVRANIALSSENARDSLQVLGPAVDRGELTVVGAYYDLDDGRVVFG